MVFRMPRVLAAAAAAAVLVVAGGPAAAAADGPVGAPAAVVVKAKIRIGLVCTVNDNGVNYRGGPGTDFPVLGQANRGQLLSYRGRTGDWIMGDLVGGRTGVWIYAAYLDC